MLRKFILSDAFISLSMHGLKLFLALTINWIILLNFSTKDYVIWMVTSSILIVATAADLGLGQYVTLKYINTKPKYWAYITQQSIKILFPLVIFAIAFVYISLDSDSIQYKILMAIFLGIRLLTIPFSSILNSKNQFKLRKIVDVGIYFVSLILISIISYYNKPVTWALLIFNACFMFGGGVLVFLSLRYFNPIKILKDPLHEDSFIKIYKGMLPFMVNNLSGLMTYGGFIWISSFFLETTEMAKISVFYTFILINLYQIYDVILRARQADLIKFSYVEKQKKISNILFFICPILIYSLSQILLPLVAGNINFSNVEIIFFSVFTVFELGFLFVQSVLQVSSKFNHLLILFAIIKTLIQALGLLIFYFLVTVNNSNLIAYLFTLSISTSIAYFICRVHLKRIGFWSLI